MQQIAFIVFKYLTYADFFNIYKPAGAEAGGGGQTYIDFGTGSINSEDWQQFFQGVRGVAVRRGDFGPRREFSIRSIGNKKRQKLTIYPRRAQTYSIAAQ